MHWFRMLPIVIAAVSLMAVTTPSSDAAGNPLAAFMGASPAKTASAPPPATLDSAQINAAIATLNNPAERNALIATLQALKPATPASPTNAAAAKPNPSHTAPKATAAKATTNQAKPSPTNAAGTPVIGTGFVETMENQATVLLSDVGGALKTATDIKLLWHWVVFVATDAWLRQTVLRAATRLAIVLVTALAGEYLTQYLLRRPRAALLRRAVCLRDASSTEEVEGLAAAEAGETEQRPRRRSLRRWFRRLPYAIGHFLLALAPIVVFIVIGFLWLSGSLANQRVSKLVVIAVLNAYLACRITLEVARFLLAPAARDIRLIRTTDNRSQWLVRWLRRIVAVVAFGYGAIATGTLFGLYHAASQVLIKLVSLIVHIMAAIMVLQARRPVAAMIRGNRTTDHSRSGVITAARAGLGRSWHILALFYIVALWVAWAIGIPHAFFIMLRIVLVFTVIVAIAHSLSTWIGHSLESAFDDEASWRAQYPGLFMRLRLYVPMIKLVISVALGVLALLVILQLWGIGVLAWFTNTQIGQRIVTAAITIGLAALIGLIVWELINTALEAQAERLVQQGRPGRAARYRTLLPMLRSTLLVIILVIVSLVVLSAVGVNVTLLLGGLSIFGLAIGFGSQKLVQDIITGLFLLLEDAMQVGDTVTLGGMSGVVEKLSIRTIRLRGGDGSLNIIPFSSVSTVTNNSRDFGYAPINIGVGYGENIDHVQNVINEEFEAMRAEPTWAAQISNDLELWGLDQFGASSINIVGRIKTPAGKQYGVRREFNRRIKIRFDADGIEIPFNYTKLTIDPAEFRAAFGAPKTESAPPQPADKPPANG